MLKAKLFEQIKNIDHGFNHATESLTAPPVLLKQIHSTIVHAVNQACDLTGDGIFTTQAKLALAVKTADCVPLLFCSQTGQQIAAVHAGWRGLSQGIIQQCLQFFTNQGVNNQNILVAIGPAIGACCFEVGPEVKETFAQNYSYLKNVFYPQQPNHLKNFQSAPPSKIANEKYWIDLRAIAQQQLLNLNFLAENIELVGHCTYCSQPDFASFRRATQQKLSTSARQLSWIKIL